MTALNEQNKREVLEERIRLLADQAANAMGIEIVLIEIKGGGRPVVTAYIDQPEGVTLADCERFSKRFSVLLDVEDWIPSSYMLEVSSPGLNRPLVKQTDFERFAGKRARVRTRRPVGGQRNFKGTILGAAQACVELEIAPGKQVSIAIGDIEKANLIIEI
jgi:ribosome maturation factor RimP